jgi:hypothetical protein
LPSTSAIVEDRLRACGGDFCICAFLICHCC